MRDTHSGRERRRGGRGFVEAVLVGALTVGALTVGAPAPLIETREAHAHAWAKQRPVLFASYEVTDTLLRATVCLPRELMNGLLRASVDFDRPLPPRAPRGGEIAA